MRPSNAPLAAASQALIKEARSFDPSAVYPIAPGPAWTPRVLVVEDDAALATVLFYNLEKENFAPVLLTTGDAALDYLNCHAVDLVLLDWMIPGVSGIEVCRCLRRLPDGWRTGVIMISARDDEGDRICGLEMGADDYLTKPFSMAEMIARARAVIRRAGVEW